MINFSKSYNFIRNQEAEAETAERCMTAARLSEIEPN
jgi:hypothetical protein